MYDEVLGREKRLKDDWISSCLLSFLLHLCCCTSHRLLIKTNERKVCTVWDVVVKEESINKNKERYVLWTEKNWY